MDAASVVLPGRRRAAARNAAALVGMPALSIAGMAAGLVVDCWSTPPALLASLCLDPTSPVAATIAHWRVLPATHAGMLIAATCGSRCAPGIEQRRNRRGWPIAAATAAVARVLPMLVGMEVGGWLARFAPATVALEPFPAMLVGMFLGMLAGAAVPGWLRVSGYLPAAVAGVGGPPERAKPRSAGPCATTQHGPMSQSHCQAPMVTLPSSTTACHQPDVPAFAAKTPVPAAIFHQPR